MILSSSESVIAVNPWATERSVGIWNLDNDLSVGLFVICNDWSNEFLVETNHDSEGNGIAKVYPGPASYNPCCSSRDDTLRSEDLGVLPS
ncbi:hypothetical protein PoB_007586200 [Plakobranchus ocellatus]|uniref:Uncharacterized protein n=1 Tax=Plakobranchus ocellatus TaxID=259542 RepID=A0AAV4DZ92_9GAST|nr:hypothetical protein PoB_007586200 [Plakobranchus ocellatus]